MDQMDKPEFDGSEAVDFIIMRGHEKAKGTPGPYPGGKTTNVALALKKEPAIARAHQGGLARIQLS